MAVVAVVVLGFFLYGRPARPVIRPVGDGPDVVTVFFPDGHGRLAKKMVEVRKRLPDRARAEVLFNELKEARSIPDRLRLYEVALGDGGVLYLDVSKEFMDPETPEREVSMVYGIVDSFLASFPQASSVQLLVEGSPVYTRSGLLYILEPLQFNKELLED